MTGAVTRQQSSVKRYRDLAKNAHAGGLDREVLLDGVHLLAEARASGVPIDSAAFDHVALERPDARHLAEKLTADGTEVLIVSRKVLESMSPVKTPSGVVGIARRSMSPLHAALGHPSSLVVIAHDIQDPGNVGALVRTAEAAGATAFVACGATADALSWKALRGSMGSGLRVPMARAGIGETIQACRTAGLRIAAITTREGTSLFASDLRPPTAILLGSEGAGLPETLLQQADLRVSIPMTGRVESLNVSVAAALVLYEAFRQRS